MGSYNYEALHKHTPGMKRAWMPDPLPANRGYINGMRVVQEPYINGYENAFQDRILLAQATQAQAAQVAQAQVQAQMLNGISHYGITKYNLPSEPPLSIGLLPQEHLIPVDIGGRERYGNSVYSNGLPIRRPIFPPIREPRRELRRERRLREPAIREPEPIRELSTSQSPAHIPEATTEPPLAGMIFGCTSDTYIECMQMKLFALPAANKTEVNVILYIIKS